MADPKLVVKASSANGYIKPYEAARAFNGSATPLSRWLCNLSSIGKPATLTCDVGIPYYVSRWVVKGMPVAGWQQIPNYCLSDYTFKGSNDGVNFFAIDSVTGNTAGYTDRPISNPTMAYRYYQVSVSKGINCNPQLASIVEFEVYGARSSYLSGLTVINGSSLLPLTPPFVKTTFTYSVPDVANSVTSIAITPTAEDSSAIIKVNGATATSGLASTVNLVEGNNAIQVVVTSADNANAKMYTVNVKRAAASKPSTLSNLVLSTGTLNPTFTPNTTSYTANVANSTASITVTPTSTDSAATIRVNGVVVASGQASGAVNLNVGANTITVAVTASDGSSTTTYNVVVTRAAAPKVSTLSNLVLSAGTLNPTFTPNTTSYTANVANSAASITVTPTSTDSTATIKVNGVVVASGQASGAINLNVGTNTVTVAVTASDGSSTTTYSVVVTRAADPTATSIIVRQGGKKVTVTIVSGVYNYTCGSIPPTVSSVYLTVNATDPNASITINGVSAQSGVESPTGILVPGTATVIVNNGTPYVIALTR